MNMGYAEDFQTWFLQAHATYCPIEKTESWVNPNYEGLESETKKS